MLKAVSQTELSALPVPYVPVRVTRGAIIAHPYTYAPPRCRTSQYRRTFIPLSVSLWNDLSDPVFDGVRLASFKSRANAFLLAWLLAHFLSLAVFLLSFYRLVLWGWGFRTDRILKAVSQQYRSIDTVEYRYCIDTCITNIF